MAATYSGDPSASDLDRVRFDIGDTDVTSPLLTDEEIQFIIATYTSYLRWQAECLQRIGMKLLRQPNFGLDKWREDRHTVAKSFLEEAKALRKRAGSQGIYAGGISIADKEAQEANTDRVMPFAKVDEDVDDIDLDTELEGVG